MNSATRAILNGTHEVPAQHPKQPTHVSAGNRSAPAPSGTRSPLWPRLLEWVLLSGIPIAVTLSMKPWLMNFWDAVTSFWASRLGLPMVALGIQTGHPGEWATSTADGTFMPSSLTLMWTWLGLLGLWGMSHFFSDRFHPLKVTLRALCLIQGTACAFFMLAPASFPYTVSKHTHALLDMGYGLMLAVGPMLALGWGILVPSLMPKILAPLGVLAYFSIMLPHKVLLHAWILAKGSALFMPTLFLCFGALLDLWIFIALYAWLVSQMPRRTEPIV